MPEAPVHEHSHFMCGKVEVWRTGDGLSSLPIGKGGLARLAVVIRFLPLRKL